MSKKYDLALAMATYFNDYKGVNGNYRRNLYAGCIDSLYRLDETDWLGMKVVLVIRDDHSDVAPFKPCDTKFDVDYFVHPYHQATDSEYLKNLFDCVLEASKLAQWTLWLDSDGLMAHDCPRRMFDLVHKFPNSPAYGTFNTPLAKTIESYPDESYVLKERLTEHGTLFRSANLDSFAGGFWMQLCARRGVNNVYDMPEFWPCLAPSGVQHTGMSGYNNPDGNDFDPEFVL